jgi:hypothetical protein
MKVAELLRSLLDVVDNAETIAAVPQARNDVQNFAAPEEVTVSNNVEDPEDLFLPPLQMKMELLKKAVGVENVYDDGTDAEREQQETFVGDADSQSETTFERELSQIKKAAGLNPVVVSELADDEPLES